MAGARALRLLNRGSESRAAASACGCHGQPTAAPATACPRAQAGSIRWRSLNGRRVAGARMRPMQAMVLTAPGQPLVLQQRPEPQPGPLEVRLRVLACAVCRTDLHVADGDLPQARYPIVPGHEVVGIVEAVGTTITPDMIGRRVGLPWLGGTCGHCPTRRDGLEFLAHAARHPLDVHFTSYPLAEANAALDGLRAGRVTGAAVLVP
jgi:D-arabinose 1-dehydrogenase-like Zn-dependent alcohol dehydrogenase